LNFVRAGQICDGAADLEDAAISTGAEAKLVDSRFKKFFTVAVDQTVAL